MERTDSKPRVLVIDDDHDICEVISCTLQAVLGWTVMVANSGFAGLCMADQHQPSLILLDLAMPGLNGRETLAHLKRTPRTAHIPVVFVTASVTAWEAEELNSLGPLAVISKPFDPVDLASDLSRLIPN